MVIVTDDADRENEGDLIMAAEHMTTEAMAFMVGGAALVSAASASCIVLSGQRRKLPCRPRPNAGPAGASDLPSEKPGHPCLPIGKALVAAVVEDNPVHLSCLSQRC